jgi:hypothetical protein
MLPSNKGPSEPPGSGMTVAKEPTPPDPVVVSPPAPKEDPKATTVSQQQLPPPPVDPPDSPAGQVPSRPETPDPDETSAPPKSNTASAKQKVPKTGTVNPRPVKANGTLALVAECWAHVFVDGTFFGKAPRSSLVLPAGKHTLELRGNPKVIEQRKEIIIPPSATLSHTISCRAADSSG